MHFAQRAYDPINARNLLSQTTLNYIQDYYAHRRAKTDEIRKKFPHGNLYQIHWIHFADK